MNLANVQLNVKKVFISSTSDDLNEERQTTKEALSRIPLIKPVMMEEFGSQPENPTAHCLERVSECDVYIGIFGHLYGHIDPEYDLSMTELEYRKAKECDIPRLIYMMDMNVPVLPERVEDDPKKIPKLKVLKEELKNEHLIYFFRDSTDLAIQMIIDLYKLLLRMSLSVT